MYELSFGIRLPNPNFCPETIANLLRKCFYDAPNKRPDFLEIKKELQAAYHVLINLNNSNSNVTDKYTHPITLSNTMNGLMEARYLDMKSSNKRHDSVPQIVSNVYTTAEASKNVTDGDNVSISLKYASLLEISKFGLPSENSKPFKDIIKTHETMFPRTQTTRETRVTRAESYSGERLKNEFILTKTYMSDPNFNYINE